MGIEELRAKLHRKFMQSVNDSLPEVLANIQLRIDRAQGRIVRQESKGDLEGVADSQEEIAEWQQMQAERRYEATLWDVAAYDEYRARRDKEEYEKAKAEGDEGVVREHEQLAEDERRDRELMRAVQRGDKEALRQYQEQNEEAGGKWEKLLREHPKYRKALQAMHAADEDTEDDGAGEDE